jgi:sugar O-acyltransferase (sialic acid O-acetyltransferase NeuD family)
MDRVVIFGTGSYGRDAYVYFTHDSRFEISGFTVDGEYIKEEVLFERPVIPFEEIQFAFPPDEYGMFIALGYQRLNRLRAERYQRAKDKGYQLISYMSSHATVWPGAVIGENCHIGPYCNVSAYAEIGNNVILGVGSVVAHHSVVKDHCFVGARVALSGGATVEPYCFLGTNAVVRDGVAIARECVVGAGALILEDTEERGVYMGVQADRLPITSDKLPLVRQG